MAKNSEIKGIARTEQVLVFVSAILLVKIPADVVTHVRYHLTDLFVVAVVGAKN